MDISNIGIRKLTVKFLNEIAHKPFPLDFPKKNNKIKAKYKIDTDLYALVQVYKKAIVFLKSI